MVKMLVLVRHGDAESRGPAGDIGRRLTDEGRSALEAAYPEAFKPLRDATSLALWASPAIRAMQTAAVIADALGLGEDDINVRNSLYEQDQEEFLAELAQASEEIIVAVGHVPFMRHVAHYLAGLDGGFSKGEVRAIGFEGNGLTGGRVLWTVEP